MACSKRWPQGSADGRVASFDSADPALIDCVELVGSIWKVKPRAKHLAAWIYFDVEGEAYLGCGKLMDKDLTSNPTFYFRGSEVD